MLKKFTENIIDNVIDTFMDKDIIVILCNPINSHSETKSTEKINNI